MGILTKLGWRQLRVERGRTLLTIAAMTLAATLAVATLVGLRSLQDSMYQYQLSSTGGMAVAFPATNAQTVAKLSASPLLTQTQQYADEGAVRVDHTKTNDITGTIHLTAVTPASKPALQNMLASGRLPQAADEVLLADVLVTAQRKLGSTIQVKSAGHTHQYRVVGTTNVYAGSFIPTGGVLRITPQLPGRRITLLAALKNPATGKADMVRLTKAHDLPVSQLRLANQALKVMWGAGDTKARTTQITIVVVMLAVIGVVALIMIYTSINLAVQARRQRYGLLRTIGTTPQQIRLLVVQEALLLVLPALLLGGVIGIGGLALALQWMNRVLAGNELPLVLYLHVDWLPLVGAALFMVLVTLLAAARPARRASRVTPIEAIRALNPSPRLTARKLRPTWLIRHLHQPMLKLGAIFDRRDSRRGTMLVLLTVTVALFIGLTSFVGNFWRVFESPASADVIATLPGQGDQTKQLKKTLAKVTGIKRQLIVRATSVMIKNGKETGNDLTLYVVPEAQLARDFGGQPTVLNTKVFYETAKGRQYYDWQIDPKANRKLHLVNGFEAKKAGQWITPQYMALSKAPGFKGMLYPDGLAGLVISQNQFHQWTGKLGMKDADLISEVAVKLSQKSQHTAVIKALRSQFGRAQIADTVADNQQSEAIITVVRLTAWAFIALLALVCLATVINHTFANLSASRRSLAMLQSIGTTPKQVLTMQQGQYSLLLVQGWLLGSLLGIGLSALLFRVMAGAYSNAHFVWPGVQILVALAALVIVWLGFGLATWRMLNHQNIEELVRSSD